MPKKTPASPPTQTDLLHITCSGPGLRSMRRLCPKSRHENTNSLNIPRVCADEGEREMETRGRWPRLSPHGHDHGWQPTLANWGGGNESREDARWRGMSTLLTQPAKAASQHFVATISTATSAACPGTQYLNQTTS
ncbi:hypothetical protein M758_4G118700 [Ceratodon purpureus]|nr:hypothetical protein M758_4G118700 [Ceratodon purpureus]